MSTQKSKIQSQKLGFTLIELLVVIAIIALLASVALVALNNSRAKARDAKRIGDMNQMAKAMELYFNTNFSYPTVASSAVLSNVGSPPLVPSYLSTIPTAPTPAEGNCTNATNGGNSYYIYSTGGGNITGSYIITFCLGAQTGALGPGPHTLTQAGFQ